MNSSFKKCSIYKESSEIESNLFQRFIVLGVNTQILHNEYLYNTKPSVLNKSGKIKPEIISQFPADTKTNSFKDDNIIKVLILYYYSTVFQRVFL